MPRSSVFVKQPVNDSFSPLVGESEAIQRTRGHLTAVEHVRRMRGGSQAHLMRCSDNNYYVVKFPNNPQGVRILANEILGSRLAARMGLPVATGQAVIVPQGLIRYSEEMVIEMPYGRVPCQAGLCFGSRYPDDPRRVTTFDFLPDKMLMGLDFRFIFTGALVFDMWTCNTDERQFVFYRRGPRCPFRAMLIDQGYCFGGQDWSFSDAARRCLYARPAAYKEIRGLDEFEPWLKCLEHFIDGRVLNSLAEQVPPDWYFENKLSLFSLIDQLDRRRFQARELLYSLCTRFPQLFPNWNGKTTSHRVRTLFHSSFERY